MPDHPHRFLFRHKARANMKRAAARIRERIRNLIDEMHKKLALWLCRQHDMVLIPPFLTSKMAERRETRCIGSTTARMMYNWAHYRFRMRLMHKAREHPWCRVVEVREDYTSKTCGHCGWQHPKLRCRDISMQQLWVRCRQGYECRQEHLASLLDRAHDCGAAEAAFSNSFRGVPLGLVP